MMLCNLQAPVQPLRTMLPSTASSGMRIYPGYVAATTSTDYIAWLRQVRRALARAGFARPLTERVRTSACTWATDASSIPLAGRNTNPGGVAGLALVSPANASNTPSITGARKPLALGRGRLACRRRAHHLRQVLGCAQFMHILVFQEVTPCATPRTFPSALSTC